jgi:hypothetical protein
MAAQKKATKSGANRTLKDLKAKSAAAKVKGGTSTIGPK